MKRYTKQILIKTFEDFIDRVYNNTLSKIENSKLKCTKNEEF